MKKRLVTALLALSFLIGMLYIGGWPLKISLLLTGLIMVHEWVQAFDEAGDKLPKGILFSASLMQFAILLYKPSLASLGLLLVLLVLAVDFVLDPEKTVREMAVSLLAFIYIPFNLFFCFEFLHTQFLYLVFVIAFSTDTMAYLIGNLFGRHKLIPQVSPNKTLEGALGGLGGAVLVTFFYFRFLGHPIQSIDLVLVGLASVAGQLGDLFASRIKRQTGIKDFGKILPGHGGLLDRFDSILFIIPMVYALFVFSK
ncbi:MAG: phosphatidate cytidylyltransferase [Tissierellia bacterium]|nr:phosphatidate cytidylyltransferase [Tissierellia bacterium]